MGWSYRSQDASDAISDDIPINSQPNDYVLTLADLGRAVFHDNATPHIYTIPASTTVNFPVGTPITIINNTGAGVLTIAITTDTLRKGNGTAGTGSRTMTADSIATIIKTKQTEWMITGTYA